MQNVKFSNMESKSGNTVPNQFIIETKEGTYFQSYSTVIAFVPNSHDGKVMLNASKWDYSRTTNKYRGDFLRENTAETRKKIKSGEYLLVDFDNSRPF